MYVLIELSYLIIINSKIQDVRGKNVKNSDAI